MKNLLITGFFILSAFTVNAQVPVNMAGQNEAINAKPIDEVKFIAYYQLKMISDTINPDKVTDELMILKAGNKSSVFYSYANYVSDSLNIELRKKGERDNMVRGGFMFMGVGMITSRIYKNFPEGKVTTLEKIMMNSYRCEEENEVPSWQLLTDTMTILSYSCQKAVCNFKGRDYEAWFTPEIPRSEGPWKLHGLPGLIMKAADSQGHYSFECTGMVNSNEELLFGADGYEPASRINLNKIYERFTSNPTGFITSSSPTKNVIVVDEAGERKSSMNIPYNPIERD